jgi:hypothetical protein
MPVNLIFRSANHRPIGMLQASSRQTFGGHSLCKISLGKKKVRASTYADDQILTKRPKTPSYGQYPKQGQRAVESRILDPSNLSQLATERKLDHSYSSCLSEEVREDAVVVDSEAVAVVRLFLFILTGCI